MTLSRLTETPDREVTKRPDAMMSVSVRRLTSGARKCAMYSLTSCLNSAVLPLPSPRTEAKPDGGVTSITMAPAASRVATDSSKSLRVVALVPSIDAT